MLREDEDEREARKNGSAYILGFLTGEYEILPDNPVEGTYQNLWFAAQNGSTDLVVRLIQGGLDPSKDDNKAIRLALKSGYKETAGALLKDERVENKIRKLVQQKG